MTEVAVAVLLASDHVWIQERRASGHLAGIWEFPGGKLEVGETPLDALLREIEEETGLLLRAEQALSLTTLDFHYPDRALRLHYFLVPLDPGISPTAPGRWISRMCLEEIAFPPANRPVLELLKDLAPMVGSRKACK